MISLVISIIVMLILAGVTLNAAIGDNGIISQAQYATFLNEMAAVEEAVQLWKINQKETAIPANGLCKPETLSVASNKNAERLNGEVGYYRVWSMSETMPDISIFSDADDFNSEFETEMLYFPAGVQDLYYLDNEELGINSKKEYIIDAVNSMVYSTTGITIKGVRVYSTAMAKAVMNGTLDAPLFAEAEVSGTGDGEILAGNVQDEYLPDGTLNPDYNPYGFEIIADKTSSNIYKLYNNGDLYGKGIKGIGLNTSETEMNKVYGQNWIEIPEPTNSELVGYKKIIQGVGTLFYIDKNDYLWAIGANTTNKLGLTTEQLNEYTTREVIKLNVGGEKVENVFDIKGNTVFVITKNGNLYVCGEGNYGNGVGTDEQLTEFTKVNIDGKNALDIEYIVGAKSKVIKFNDGTFYAAGQTARGLVGDGITGVYKKFCPIWNGYAYKENLDGTYGIDTEVAYDESLNIYNSIKNVVAIATYNDQWIILKNDGTLWNTGHIRFNNNSTYEKFSNYKLAQYTSEFAKDIVEIYSTCESFVAIDKNNNVYGRYQGTFEGLTGNEEESIGMKKIIIPEELKSDGIKEILISTSNYYFLSNKNELWGCGAKGGLGEEYTVNGVIKLNGAPLIEEMRNDTYEYNQGYWFSAWGGKVLIFHGVDGKYYSINNDSILRGDDILQKTWIKITDLKVEKIAVKSTDYFAVIERDTNNLYVAGKDARVLAQHTDQEYAIPNLTKVDDELINGKVKDVAFADYQMYILTTDGKLYGTGLGGTTFGVSGWGEEDSYELVELSIGDKVSMIDASTSTKMYLAESGLYMFGKFNEATLVYNTPTKVDTSTLLNDGESIVDIICEYNYPQFITDAGRLITFNLGRNRKWEDMTSNFNNEKIASSVVGFRKNTSLVLTEQGNVYGIGEQKLLGVNNITEEIKYTYTSLPINNAHQIVVGSGFFIIVKEDGTVYGTGSNQYGILGRWIGVDRSSPNSRYKTAFEWVECPELEI